MKIQVDLSVIPPEVVLVDEKNFKEFAVNVRSAEHTWVDPNSIKKLAGDLAQESEWQRNFEDMLEYASNKDWVNSEGAVRAHITRA